MNFDAEGALLGGIVSQHFGWVGAKLNSDSMAFYNTPRYGSTKRGLCSESIARHW